MNEPTIFILPKNTDLSALSYRRAKDRKIMAKLTHDLAVACGCESVEMKDGHDKREKRVSIHVTRGLMVTVDFNGDSWQDGGSTFVLSWHFDYKSDTCLADAFGDVNSYHFRKSTDVCRGMENLLSTLQRRFYQAYTGKAFDEGRTAAFAAEMAARRARAAESQS